MPDPREIQINLGGFMDSYGAASFTSELWTLLLSAQETVGGMPAAVSR
jgi:serine/arginine repetitive matrix protein 1